MKIILDGGWSYFESPPDPKLQQLIAANLTWFSKDINFANGKLPRFKQQNPYVCIYHPESKKRQFLTGLVPRIQQLISTARPQLEIVYEWVNHKDAPTILEVEFNSDLMPEWAYSHQVEMVKAALESKRGILSCPTGGGKTNVAVFLLQQMPQATALITVPTKSLLSETHTLLEESLQEPIGRIGDNFCDFQRVSVGVIDSLAGKCVREHADYLRSVQILIIDEAHRGASRRYQTLAEHCVNSEYRIGLTGTPFRKTGDDIVMEGVMGPIIYKISEAELVELSKILSPTYIQINYEHSNEPYEGAIKITKDTFNNPLKTPYYTYATDNGKPDRLHVYTRQITENEDRANKALDIVEAFLNNPYRIGGALILIEKINQGKLIKRLADERGINCEFISGATKTTRRVELVKQLGSGELDVLIASNILNEGENIPSLQLVLIAGGGGNEKTIVQQAGRGTRTCKDREKRFALVVDFFDIERYYLERNSQERREAMLRRYSTVTPRLCIEEAIKLVGHIQETEDANKTKERGRNQDRTGRVLSTS